MRKHEKPKAVETGGNGAQPPVQPEQTAEKAAGQQPLANIPTSTLKEWAYDRWLLIEKAKADFIALNQEIARRG